jgi:hypothetical protein
MPVCTLPNMAAICTVLIFVASQSFVSSAFVPKLPIFQTRGPCRMSIRDVSSATSVVWANMASTTNTTSVQLEEEGGRSINNSRRAREMLRFLQARFDKLDASTNGSTANNDKKSWTKTQMYLYRAHSRLTWEQLEGVSDFLDARVPPSTARTILQTAPRILRKPVASFLKPTADFLLDLWGPDLFQEAINRNPQLLLSSGVGYTQRQEEADEEIAKILSSTAGLSSKAVLELKRTAPFVFGLSTQKLKYVLGYLLELLYATDHEKMGKKRPSKHRKILARKTLARIIVTHPHLLNLAVDTNLKPRVEFLQSACGMNATHIAKMVHSSTGTVLSLSIDEKLKPTLDYLNPFLSSKDLLRKCLLSHPQILTLSMSNLQSKVQYFSEIEAKDDGSTATISPDDDSSTSADSSSSSNLLASRILSRCPAVYSLSLTDNIQPKIDALSKAWGVSKISNENGDDDSKNNDNNNDINLLSHWLQEFPNILTMSLEGNIRPTLNFYNRTQYTVLTDDWELVPGATRISGRYMAASLYNRLLPRWHYCLSQGVMSMDGSSTIGTAELSPSPPAAAASPTTNAPPLHLLVQASDAAFCEKLGLNCDEYADFREGAIPRLKFSSQFDTWLKTGRPIQV